MTTALHWTEKSLDNFVSRISFDFITQLAKKMESLSLTRGGLATKLGLTEGRISQIFNNPGNLTLANIVKYARVVGMKVAIVAYDDDDANNKRGPINSEIFTRCWEANGKPVEAWSTVKVASVTTASTSPFQIITTPMKWQSLYETVGEYAYYTATVEKLHAEAFPSEIFDNPSVFLIPTAHAMTLKTREELHHG